MIDMRLSRGHEQLPPGAWELMTVPPSHSSFQVRVFSTACSENKIKYFRDEGVQQKGRAFCFVVVHIFVGYVQSW